MELAEAWTALGMSPDGVHATIAKLPREKRVEAAEKLASVARRMAGKASAPHHPDRGGDPEKFKRVWAAVDAIERHTAEFRVKMTDLDRRIVERAETGPFIELKK